METWGNDEGEDFNDVFSKTSCLLTKQISLETELSAGLQRYRQTLKSVREREVKLIAVRDRMRAVESKLQLVGHKVLKGKVLEASRELSALEQECRVLEWDLANYKRVAMREALYVRFNSITEYAEKLSILAGFGKYLVDQIPGEPVPIGQPRNPYNGAEMTNCILKDAFSAIDSWRPSELQQRPTTGLADRMSSTDLSDHKVSASPSTNSFEERNSYVDSPASGEPPTSPFSPRQQKNTRNLSSTLPSRSHIPPSYQSNNYTAATIPTAPYEPNMRTEATEMSAPQKSQMYQVPNEIDSPTRRQFSSEQISNYNQQVQQTSTQVSQAPRPYSEYIFEKRPEVGGFRSASHDDIVLSAEEEKRKLAEREYTEHIARQRPTSPSYSASSAPPYWDMPPNQSGEVNAASAPGENANQTQPAIRSQTVRSHHSPNSYHETLPQTYEEPQYPH
ncbi:hypothetical protein INT43_004701 [Umbelopsis isabellina]|uniref:Uncharacterized protein n=1 Tax=Mortierella isabellina TaxID=91625 RepID=A0A8H7PG43_MORIS|nr:hypothetical protein INT43_004701 [Umbelopsis isabellina]